MFLEIRDLVIAAPRHRAELLRVPYVRCDLERGVAILGHSGSGKTLLLRAVAGVLPHGVGFSPSGGPSFWIGPSVSEASEEHSGNEEARPSRHLVTFVPQFAGSILPATVRVDDFLSSVKSWSTGGASRAVRDLVGELVEGLGKKRMYELSGGMAKRVVLAAAIATNPRALLLDEPTAGLDAIAQRDLRRLLRRALSSGLGLAIATHDSRIAADVSSEAIVLRSGVVAAFGDLHALGNSADPYVHDLLDDQTRVASKMPSTTSAVLVRLEGATVRYSRRGPEILRDISFEIRAGESIGVIGRSGSGKTTLALTCAGLMRPIAGRVAFSAPDSEAPEAKSSIVYKPPAAMVFQNPFAALNPRRAVGKFLRLVACRALAPERAVGESFDSLLDSLALPHRVLERLPGELSGGECQRVCIAAALIARARLLALDEPASMLDGIARRSLILLLVRLRAQHQISLLVASHDLRFILEVCDRVIVLSGGQIVESRPVKEIATSPIAGETIALFEADGLTPRQGSSVVQS